MILVAIRNYLDWYFCLNLTTYAGFTNKRASEIASVLSHNGHDAWWLHKWRLDGNIQHVVSSWLKARIPPSTYVDWTKCTMRDRKYCRTATIEAVITVEI